MAYAANERAKIYVSIIIPSLNSAQFLRECVESVLNQTLRQIELLCVDAGSTDGTLEVLEEYAAADARVHIVKSEKRSYGYQVNLGIQAAHGHYIGIVEADDYIDPVMYQTLYEYAQAKRWPDFVKSGFTQFANHEESRLFWAARRERLETLYGQVLSLKGERGNGVLDLNHIWSGIYRRGFLRETGIRLHESPGASYQDLSFSLLVGLLADTAVYVKERYYFYRMDHDHSSVKEASKWHCVIDEFQYAAGELLERGAYSEKIQALIRAEKLGIYIWNAMRLPRKERSLFFAAIQPEIDEYAKDDLPEACMECLRLLRSGAALEKEWNHKQTRLHAFRPVAERIRAGCQFALVGAGRCGEQLISFQRTFSLRFISTVADNDTSRQGGEWHQYTLLSVPEAVKRCKESDFIVANKLHSFEICQQLMELGIPANRIFAVQGVISETEFVELLLNKLISGST